LWQYSDEDPLMETSNAGDMKKSRFSTNIGNDAREAIITTERQ